MVLDSAESQFIAQGTDHALDTADNIVKELIQKFALFGHVDQQSDCMAALSG
ncbi:hypothetical protein D3C73_1593000 [compost metagenome]